MIVILAGIFIVLLLRVLIYIFNQIHRHKPIRRKTITRELLKLFRVFELGVIYLFVTTLLFHNAPKPQKLMDSEEEFMLEHGAAICQWENYEGMNREQREELCRQMIALECEYLGLEQVPVLLVETYENTEKMGYYSVEENVISVSEGLLEKEEDMLELMDTVLHEVGHLYSIALVQSLDWSELESLSHLRCYTELYELKESIRNYEMAETSFENYYRSKSERFAREYAENRMESYFYYMDVLRERAEE